MKRLIKSFIFVLLVLSLGFSGGCSFLQSVGDKIDENQVLVSLATSQVVSRYIEAAGNIDAQKSRAKDVQRRINKVLAYVDGEPQTTVDQLLSVIDSVIEWEKLSISDRILVIEIVRLVKSELIRMENDSPVDLVALRPLLETAVLIAQMFLR